ncbi:hypothetical protein EDC04DRAFT_2957796 [Pisolithus marmoratus]|nr:hypothetical protein EDC04DRAFT_2957796 [Pisolithus marmoratus]
MHSLASLCKTQLCSALVHIIASTKPLLDLSSWPLPPIEEPHDADNDSGVGLPMSSPIPNPADPAIKSSGLKSSSSSISMMNMDTQKKVTFLSPLQTPSGLLVTQPLPDTNSSTNTRSSQQSSADAASKSTTTSTPSPTATAPPAVTQLAQCQTLFSQMSMSSTHIPAVSLWSEGAKEDLISNLGPCEWTRQEVLWEIVTSEEQYVGELQKMKETFIDPLLHPYASPPPTSPTPYDYDEYSIAPSRFKATQDSMDTLPPIAAHFMLPTGFCNKGPSPQAPDTKSLALTTPNIDGESVDADADDAKHVHRHLGNHAKVTGKHSHPHSPYHIASAAAGKNGKTKEMVHEVVQDYKVA